MPRRRADRSPVSGFQARDAKIYRPYPDEVPWDLLAAASADEDALRDVLELNLVRVAKHQDRVVGGYGLRPLTPLRYQLVVLVVAEAYRGHGLGRWLLGHAIGLAESRGGREIVVAKSAARGLRRRSTFLIGVGFEAQGENLELALTPE